MKIAHVISTFPPYRGGMGNSARYFALEVGNLGHDLTVFTPLYGQSGYARQERVSPGVEVKRLKPLFSIGNGAVIPQIMNRLSGFDVVHLHYPFYGAAEFVMAAIAWRRMFKPTPKLILHYHMDAIGRGVKGFIFWAHRLVIVPLLVRLADLITCASYDYIKHSNIADYCAAHKSKFVQVPFGVDINRFKPAARSGDRAILFVGGLDTQHNFKGIPELIAAFAKVLKQYPDTRLTLVGRGNLEEYYRKLVDRAGLGEAVSIRADVSNEQLPEFYQQATVCVLPSINRSEAFGLVLLEAMACGTPVIASNLPGVRNVFRNHKHGWLVQPGNSDDLAAKLSAALADPARTAALGLAARQWVETKHDWHRVGHDLETAYYRVLNTPKPLRRHSEEE